MLYILYGYVLLDGVPFLTFQVCDGVTILDWKSRDVVHFSSSTKLNKDN